MSNECPTWFDAGVNLFSTQFDGDRLEMLQRAFTAGIERILLISSDLAETDKNLAFCRQQPRCITTAGVHPHQADAVAEDWLSTLEKLAQSPDIAAIGECGLDFNRMFSEKNQQIHVLQSQLALAKKYQKAVYLHERDAFTTQISILKEQQIQHGIAHCFTGDPAQLGAYLDLGLYIGITGWLCDDRRGVELQQALHYLPLDRLILETDAPYLLPKNIQPKPKSRRNEPALLPAIAAKIAEIRGWSIAEIAHHSSKNAAALLQQGGLDDEQLA